MRAGLPPSTGYPGLGVIGLVEFPAGVGELGKVLHLGGEAGLVAGLGGGVGPAAFDHRPHGDIVAAGLGRVVPREGGIGVRDAWIPVFCMMDCACGGLAMPNRIANASPLPSLGGDQRDGGEGHGAILAHKPRPRGLTMVFSIESPSARAGRQGRLFAKPDHATSHLDRARRTPMTTISTSE
jgi:hypothetical protein